MECNWEDLPKPLNCFTVRNATMINLNTKKIIQHYSANTKIVVVQKCVTEKGTYYRTDSARHHYLNYAFEATALGLPNEVAPSVPDNTPKINSNAHRSSSAPVIRKQKTLKKTEPPKDGVVTPRKKSLFRRLFRK